jgi:uncharacterized membrane protein
MEAPNLIMLLYAIIARNLSITLDHTLHLDIEVLLKQ